MPGYGSHSLQVFNAQQTTMAAQRAVSQTAYSQSLNQSPPLGRTSGISWARAGLGSGLASVLAGCGGRVSVATSVDATTAVSAGNFFSEVFSDASYTTSAVRGTWDRVVGVIGEYPIPFLIGFTALGLLIWKSEKKRESFVNDESVSEEVRKLREKLTPHMGPTIMKLAVAINGIEIAFNFNRPTSRACHDAWGDVVVAAGFLLMNGILEKAFEKAHERKKSVEDGIMVEARPSLSPEAIRKMQLVLWFTCLLDDVALPILYMIRQAHV